MSGVHIDDLLDEFLKCKVVGHAWDEFIPHRKPPKFGDLMAWLCVRCQTERHDIVSWADGGLVAREYRYPEGYQLAERYRRQELRLTMLRRKHPRRKRAS